MDELDYWTRPDRTPKPVVDLRGARCRRCPHALPPVPADKVRLTRDGDGALHATFVCPHCRTTATVPVTPEAALAAYAAGAEARRVPAPRTPVEPDDVLDFALAAARTDELALLALRDSLR